MAPGPTATAPCGTVSAYKRHHRRGEQACDKCRAAWAEYHRSRYVKRKTTKGKP